MYKVHSPVDRWILISSDDPGAPYEFAALLKAYNNRLHGRITEVSSSMQYRINNDELKLIFQWDSLFGIVVIVPEHADPDKAYRILKSLCANI